MKSLFTAVFLLTTALSFAQEEIKLPDLDTENKVYVLEFSPDPKNEQVISAYMKGTTEADSLRFWAEGTPLTQNVMVTVYTPDKMDIIKVDIVKDHWEDSKIDGYTKDGVFQQSFGTANKFGIVISSEKPNIPFHLAVWTTGENLPYMGSLYYPASEDPAGTNNFSNTSLSQESKSVSQNGNNTLMYIIIGVLILIAIFLALLVIKKKSGKALGIFICFFLAHQIAHADAIATNSIAWHAFSHLLDSADDLNEWLEKARNTAGSIEILLDPSDSDYRPEVDPAGGPRLPSSCLPPRFGNNGGGNSEVQNRNYGSSGSEGTGTTLESSSSFDTASNPDSGSDIDDQGRPSYDAQGEPILYDDSKNPKYDSKGDAIDYGDIDPNGDFDSKGRLKYDSKGDPISYDDAKNPKYDANGKKIDYDTDSAKDNLDQNGRPKYDSNGQPISYDDSKYPKYDSKGDPIDYGDIDPKGDFDSKGRPKKDAKGQPINYDESKYPKYDSKGKPIEYGDSRKDGNKSNNSKTPAGDKNKTSSKNGSVEIGFRIPKSEIKQLLEIEVPVSKKESIPISRRNYAEANIAGFLMLATMENDQQEAGCACLDLAYRDLNRRRLNLERLRVIFAHAMKKINAGISFGDNVSGVHGVSGLAWQSQKMIILKESIPTLNRAYDSKYAEMIQALEENLRKIEECEVMLGNENWYNHAGFIYYQFMADKYKRN